MSWMDILEPVHTPKKGDKYVWENESLTPPPIYVRINQVRGEGRYVSADCWQGDKKWTRPFTLPLYPSMTPRDWTFEEIGIST